MSLPPPMIRFFLLLSGIGLLATSVVSAVPFLTAETVGASVLEGKDASFDVSFTNDSSGGHSLKVKSIMFSEPLFMAGDKEDRISRIMVGNDKLSGLVLAPNASGTFSIICKTVDDGAPFDDGDGLWEFSCWVVYQWIVDGVEPRDSSHKPQAFLLTVQDPKKVPEIVSTGYVAFLSLLLLAGFAVWGRVELLTRLRPFSCLALGFAHACMQKQAISRFFRHTQD